jgi:myb proto-oncogene protein
MKTTDEDSKLKDAVQTHREKDRKDWFAIAALVPGRTNAQCTNRWRDVLKHSIDQATGLTGKWTEDEFIKLKDAVETHGGKNWFAIAVLVPGRTNAQCTNRWLDVLNANIDRATGLTGKWTED